MWLVDVAVVSAFFSCEGYTATNCNVDYELERN